MTKFLSKISPSERKSLIYDNAGEISDYANVYGLMEDSVAEIAARCYVKCLDFEEELRKASSLSDMRKSKSELSSCEYLWICNHPVVMSCIYGSIDLSGSEHVDLSVKLPWIDVLYLSAIYTALRIESARTGSGAVRLHVSKVYGLVHPGNIPKHAVLEKFAMRLNGVIDDFGRVSGTYERGSMVVDVDGSYFFRGRFEGLSGHFAVSACQEDAESSRRLVKVPCEWLMCDRTTEWRLAIKTYLIYRHECKGLGRKVNISSMQMHLGGDVERHCLRGVLSCLERHGMYAGWNVTGSCLVWNE